jgi:predicted RNA-binding protein with PUA-like domain
MKCWMVKSEPETYPWQRLVEEGRAAWDGVRNFEARNNLRAMKQGDRVLFYHSGGEKRVVGVAEVAREAYADPTAKEGGWSAVDLIPKVPLESPVTLAAIKADSTLAEVALIRRPRLSVVPLTSSDCRRILALGKTKI